MKIITLPTIFAVTAHITLSAGYVATVYSDPECNSENPQYPTFSAVGSNLYDKRTGCIALEVPLDDGSFSLTGCTIGGSASIFSDTACTQLLTMIGPYGTTCARFLPVGSFFINKC